MSNLTNNFPEILTTCRFFLRLELKVSQEPVDAYFMECKGLKRSQEAIEVCEVTPQQWGKANNRGLVVRTKIPGNVKSNNLILRRGMTCSNSLWQWFEDVQKGNWHEQRRDGYLTIYDQAGKAQARFSFQRAWPVSYTLTDINASSNEIEIEEVELAIEEFTREKDVAD